MAVGWQATITIAIWISVLIQLTYATAKVATFDNEIDTYAWKISIHATAKAATHISTYK